MNSPRVYGERVPIAIPKREGAELDSFYTSPVEVEPTCHPDLRYFRLDQFRCVRVRVRWCSVPRVMVTCYNEGRELTSVRFSTIREIVLVGHWIQPTVHLTRSSTCMAQGRAMAEGPRICVLWQLIINLISILTLIVIGMSKDQIGFDSRAMREKYYYLLLSALES